MSNHDFIGLGSSSSMFSRNNVVIATANGVAKKIVLTVRGPVPNTGIQAIVWRRPTGGVAAPTVLATVVIPNGMTQQCAIGFADVPVNECDEISAQINWATGGALANGCAVTIIIAATGPGI